MTLTFFKLDLNLGLETWGLSHIDLLGQEMWQVPNDVNCNQKFEIGQYQC
jgi:hypothetical protein